MHRYGILGAYLPVFDQVAGQMQYDLFHVYTVDEHSLFVVRNLRMFADPARYLEFPHCADIFARLPKPELIYVAGLFHDVAKGRNGDHSELARTWSGSSASCTDSALTTRTSSHGWSGTTC